MKTRHFRNFLLGLVGALVTTLGLSIFTATTATTGFYYSVTDLGTLGGSSSRATSINDTGQVVGWSNTSGQDNGHAFLWQDGSMRDLGTLGGAYSWASSINNQGQIVGEATLSNGFSHAVLWQDGIIRDLGTLSGTSSGAGGINNQGQIVGSVTNGTDIRHAVLWNNGTLIDLHPPNDFKQSLQATRAYYPPL